MLCCNIQYQCFPQKEIATGRQGGPDDSLSSTYLQYAHIVYEGKDVRVYRTIAILQYYTTAKEFQHHIEYSALYKICC